MVNLTLIYTSSFNSISNRGKWACSRRIGPLPPGQKCIVAVARECLSAQDLAYISSNGTGTAWTVLTSWPHTTHVNLGARWSYLAVRSLWNSNAFWKKWSWQGKILFCIFKLFGYFLVS